MAGLRAGGVVATALVAVLVGGCGSMTVRPTGSPGEVVRGGFGGGFFWSGGAEPAIPVGAIDPAATRTQVDRSLRAVRPDLDDTFSLAIVATFPSSEDATREASSLRDVLAADERWFADPAHAAERAALLDPDRDPPISDPAAAWLSAANLAPGTRGLGWAGGAAGSDDPADVVWTIGRTVLVTGLKAEAPGTTGLVPPLQPIVHRWAAAGAQVLVEGDRAGEGAIAADVTCQPADAATGATLRDVVGDTIGVGRWYALPPWVREPTADVAVTRAAIARYQELAATAFDDPEIADLAQKLAFARPAEREALMAAFSRRIAQRVQELAAGRVDPAIIELMGRQPTGDDASASAAWNREVRAKVGTVELRPTGDYPTADAYGPTVILGTTRVSGGRLQIGGLGLGRVSTGLPLVLAWLTERGCTDLRIGLEDAEP